MALFDQAGASWSYIRMQHVGEWRDSKQVDTAQPLAAAKTGTAYGATIDLPPMHVEQPNRCSRQRPGNVLVRRKQGIFSRG